MEGGHRPFQDQRMEAGRHQGRGLGARHFQREAGPGQHAVLPPGPQLLGNLVADEARLGFQALAQPDHGCARRDRLQHGAQA